MPRHLTTSLAVMRLTVGVFFPVWALEKIVAQEAAIRVAETFYGFTPDATAAALVGAARRRPVAAISRHGLIGTVLTQVSAGSPSVSMNPAAFLQRPAWWLAVLSHCRATVTAAPSPPAGRSYARASRIGVCHRTTASAGHC